MGPLAAMMALQAIGGLYSGYQQSKTLKQESYDLDNQANELNYRANINKKAIEYNGQQLYGQQVSASAASGADVSTGSPLLAYAQGFEQTTNAKINMMRENDMQVSALRTTATNYRKQAKMAMYASVLNAGGKGAESLYQYNQAKG